MEKERIEAGAALLHRLQRVTTLITHMKNLEGDLVKLTVGNQGNYPVNSYYAPISREAAEGIISVLAKEKDSLEKQIAEI